MERTARESKPEPGYGQLQGRQAQRAVSAHIPAIIGLERCCRTLLTFVNKLGEEQIQNAVLGSIPEHGPDKAELGRRIL